MKVLPKYPLKIMSLIMACPDISKEDKQVAIKELQSKYNQGEGVIASSMSKNETNIAKLFIFTQVAPDALFWYNIKLKLGQYYGPL